MITTPAREDIRAFAASVRAQLDDLPADEIDDLLDGLEADLSDQATEAGDDFELPDATTYAAELRAAAGLPERSDAVAATRKSLAQQVREGWRELGASLTANPAGAWTLDLLRSLRPVWWLVRGFVWYLMAYFVMLVLVPSAPSGGLLGAVFFVTGNPLTWVILLGAVLLSVQWGRGRWLPRPWVRVLRTVMSVGAVLALPVLALAISTALTQALTRDSYIPDASYVPGLSVDGQRVRNIFAFDAEGNALPAVQLFDQDGTPLTTVGREMGQQPYDSYFYGGGGPVPVPYTAPGASDAWNIYPLREIPADAISWDDVDDVAKAKPTTFPFLRVQPIPTDAVLSPEPSPTAPVATPSPGAEATAP